MSNHFYVIHDKRLGLVVTRRGMSMHTEEFVDRPERGTIDGKARSLLWE